MFIKGLQKLTLLDYPGKTACTVFTGGCNFRCPFCHNSALVVDVDEERIDESEVFALLKKRHGILDGVAVTGGEPLLQKDIEPFLAKVKEAGFLVKLDTNGSFPQKLRSILHAGLADYVAMDIKNCRSKYAATAGFSELDLSKVEESIDLLLEGKTDYEFRTTVVGDFHTPDDIEQIAMWIEGAPRYFLQNFVDSGDLIDEGCTGVTKAELLEMQRRAKRYVPNTELRGVD